MDRDELTWRALTAADAERLHTLIAQAEAVDRTGEHFAVEDVVEELEDDALSPGDVVGAFAAGEELVGYHKVLARGEVGPTLRYHVEGMTQPAARGRGLGTELVRRMLARVEEDRSARGADRPARLAAHGIDTNTAQHDVLTAAGFVVGRWQFSMRARLDTLPPPAPLPPGYRLLEYDDRLAAAMHAAHNAAFVDHPDFTPWSDQMWRQWVTGSRSFRPALTLLAATDGSDDVAGYVQTAEFDAHQQATGRREAYVAKVGTLREHRGRGLAGALLQQVLARARAAGFDEAALDVDTHNPTGALGVYERAGFTVESRWYDYVLDLPPQR